MMAQEHCEKILLFHIDDNIDTATIYIKYLFGKLTGVEFESFRAFTR